MAMSDRRIEYETHGLDLSDLLADPIAQWRRWFDEAVAAGCTEPEAAALATVDDDGLPDCRFVLVRDAGERGFSFYTNLESPKARHLLERPFATLVFPWLQLHRQVRIGGRATILEDEEADAYFAGRPRGSQIGAWASDQSSIIPDRAFLEARVAEEEARFDGGDVSRPPNWGGFRLVPEIVEFWQGRPSRLHDRLRYTRQVDDGSWAIDRLAP
jgi:pyridoxamine 5'-phosphate oxidase